MISFISSWEIISFVKPDPNIFWSVVGSVIAAAAAGNPNGVKTFLANDLSTFKGNPLKAIHFLAMVLKGYLKILLIALFYVTEFLITLY